jgi:hypothetical protein
LRRHATMHCARRRPVFATRGRGTVARSNPRLAAAVGLVATFVLLGGPGLAAAIADPGNGGGSGGWGGNSDKGSGDSRRGSGGGGGDRDDNSGSRRGGDGANGRGNDSLRPSSEAPQTRVGTGRADVQQDSPGDRSGSNGGSGSDHPGAPSAKFEPPKVTVGNGRTPGIQDRDREPRWRVSAPEPAPPPPPPSPPPAPAPSWVERIHIPPAMPKQLGVAPASNMTDPMWGIAGLLLIPVAGAVLGYRQARASQAAAELGRHP